VVVFRRGNSSWQGHVAFYLGQEGSRIVVLGGNQTDAVTIASYSMAVLGCRTPTTLTNSRTIKAQVVTGAGGAVTMGAGQLASQASQLAPANMPDAALHTDLAQKVSDAGGILQSLGTWSPWLFFFGGMLMLGGVGWTSYARYLDWKEKGR
jgi:hypothetical protein